MVKVSKNVSNGFHQVEWKCMKSEFEIHVTYNVSETEINEISNSRELMNRQMDINSQTRVILLLGQK